MVAWIFDLEVSAVLNVPCMSLRDGNVVMYTKHFVNWKH